MNIQIKRNLIKALAQQRKGFTLIELMISIFLIACGLTFAIIIIALIAIVIHYVGKYW